jgi:sulfur carrier protein
MRITVNGTEREMPQASTVAELLAGLGLSDKRVAVELNRSIIAREDYAATGLSEGDVLEILSFVGGG